MPRPGPRRPYVAVKMADSGLAWIDAEAERRDLNRSEMIRLMLQFATAKMPETYGVARRTDEVVF